MAILIISNKNRSRPTIMVLVSRVSQCANGLKCSDQKLYQIFKLNIVISAIKNNIKI